MLNVHIPRGLKIPVSGIRFPPRAPKNKAFRGWQPSCQAHGLRRFVQSSDTPLILRRTCPKCGQICTGTRNRCRPCVNRVAKEDRRDNLGKYLGQERARSRAHRAANPDHCRAVDVAWKRKKSGYPIHGSAVVEMRERQGGGCAICGTTDPGGGKGWSVDHDHTTGFIRGVLCRTCNTGLGCLKDSPELVLKAHAYLCSAKEAEAARDQKIEAFRLYFKKYGRAA